MGASDLLSILVVIEERIKPGVGNVRTSYKKRSRNSNIAHCLGIEGVSESSGPSSVLLIAKVVPGDVQPPHSRVASGLWECIKRHLDLGGPGALLPLAGMPNSGRPAFRRPPLVGRWLSPSPMLRPLGPRQYGKDR